MKPVILITILFVALSNITFAEFPAEEIWHVDFDTSATVLGPSWEEDGQWYFLVGLSNKAVIVSEGELVWESDIIIEGRYSSITSISRVDYGLGDGPEVVVCSSTRSEIGTTAVIDIFSGENYAERTTDVAPTMGMITHLIQLHHMVGDSSKPIYSFSPYTYYEDADWNHPFNSVGRHGYNQRILLNNIRSTQPASSIGFPLVVDLISVEEVEYLICGSTFYSASAPSDFIGSESGSCAISLYSDTLGMVCTLTLSHATYPWAGGQGYPMPNLFGLTWLIEDNQSPSVFVCYCDSAQVNYLVQVDYHDFRPERRIVVPVTGSLKTFTDVENNSVILIINDEGQIGVVDASNCTFGFEENIGISMVGVETGSYDYDANDEIAWLSSSSLYLFDIGPLSVSPSSFIPYPSLELFAAYPNPFNSSATIEYRVGSDSNPTTLSLYDLSGRLVQTLVEGRLTPGNYRTTLNANGLTSGVYVVRMEADSPQPPLERGVYSRKVVVVK